MVDTSSTGAGAGDDQGMCDGNSGNGDKGFCPPEWTDSEKLELAIQGIKQLVKQVEDKRGAVDTNQFQVGTRTKASMDKAWKALKDRATIYQKDPNGPAPTPRKTPRKPGEEPAKPAKKRTKTYKPNNFKNDNRRDDHDDNRGGPNSGIEAN